MKRETIGKATYALCLILIAYGIWMLTRQDVAYGIAGVVLAILGVVATTAITWGFYCEIDFLYCIEHQGTAEPGDSECNLQITGPCKLLPLGYRS